MRSILEANLRALTPCDPGLASRISACGPSPDVGFRTSSRGAAVPVIRVQGREISLHSGVDPAAEGRRLYADIRGPGFLAFIGLGAGYHIQPALEDDGVSGILVIEKEVSFLRAILETVAMERLLGDPRVILMADPSPGEIGSVLLSRYMPSLMGGFKSFPLRTMRYPEGFAAAVAGEIAAALAAIGADLAAQAKFGRRWVTNLIANLPFAAVNTGELPSGRCILITAAGPSLDLQLPLLKNTPEDALLYSTDTALPALLFRGIRPDAVISIDCQQYGYHHYLCARSAGTPLDRIPFLLDLSSPPSLVRSAGKRIFAAGGHPLARYVSRHWLRLPELDTSGGNVAYAAVSAALSLGAEEITLFGLDYSYPDGKPYARGTYLQLLSDSRSSRTSTSESFYASIVFGRGDVDRVPIDGGWRYQNPLMRAYHGSMQRLISAAGGGVTVADGRGLPFKLPADGIKRRNKTRLWMPSPPPETDWRGFLRDYRGRVAALTVPGNCADVIRRLPDDQKEVWATLLPLVPCLESEKNTAADRLQLLDEARQWTLARVDRALSV